MRQEAQQWDKIRATLEIVAAGVGATGLAPTVAIRRVSDGLWLQAGGGSWGAGVATNPMIEPDSVNLAGLYTYAIPTGQLVYASGAGGYVFRITEATNTILQYVFVSALPDRDVIASQVWDELRGPHTAAGTFGEGVAVASVGVGAIATSSFSAGAIDSNALAADAIGSLELSAAAVAEIVDAVWDEPKAGHTTNGTFGFLAQVATGLTQFNHRMRSPTYDISNRLLSCELVVYPTAADANADINELSIVDVTMTYDVNGRLQSVLAKE